MHLLQISLRELHNYMMLSISQGGLFGSRNVDGELCICNMSLREYIPKYIKPICNRNKITCGCETCISYMLLKSDINKCILSRLAKLDKLYINSAFTILLQISKNYFIEYNTQVFPNNLHIHLRACVSTSSHHCPSPITGSNILK